MNDSLGSRVAALRAQRPGLRQQDAADAMGIKRSTLATIEAGQRMPGRSTLQTIARFYNVTMDYLESGASAARQQHPLYRSKRGESNTAQLTRVFGLLTKTEQERVLADVLSRLSLQGGGSRHTDNSQEADHGIVSAIAGKHR